MRILHSPITREELPASVENIINRHERIYNHPQKWGKYIPKAIFENPENPGDFFVQAGFLYQAKNLIKESMVSYIQTADDEVIRHWSQRNGVSTIITDQIFQLVSQKNIQRLDKLIMEKFGFEKPQHVSNIKEIRRTGLKRQKSNYYMAIYSLEKPYQNVLITIPEKDSVVAEGPISCTFY